MNIQCKLLLSVIALSGVIGGAIAQGRPDPTDSKLKSATVEYVSPFASYRRYQDEKPAPWRELNDHVLGLGGHAGHIKDGAPGAAKPAAIPERSSTATSGEPAPPQPVSTPSSGHSSHKH
ncbi:MAG: hypothetical protein ACKVQU_11525 [Burkholderiales bacterium]